MTFKFTPQQLGHWHKLHYMDLQQCDPADVTFYWNWEGTLWPPCEDPDAVNAFCTDTRKSTLDRVFNEVYGYSSQVHQGWAVEKPDNTNGEKGCQLVKLGDEREGYFYQIPFFDLRKKQFYSNELRIIVMGYKPVFVQEKIMLKSKTNLMGEVYDIREFQTIDDPLISVFCRKMGAEFCELDAIFHNGLFYIYDINPTPGSRYMAKLQGEELERYITNYKHHFYKWLNERKYGTCKTQATSCSTA